MPPEPQPKKQQMVPPEGPAGPQGKAPAPKKDKKRKRPAANPAPAAETGPAAKVPRKSAEPGPAARQVHVQLSFKRLGHKIVREVYPGVVGFHCSPFFRGSAIQFDSPATAAAAIARGYVSWGTTGCQCKRPLQSKGLPPTLRGPASAVVFFGKRPGAALLAVARAAWPTATEAVAFQNALQVTFSDVQEAKEALAGGTRTVFDDVVLKPVAASPDSKKKPTKAKKEKDKATDGEAKKG